jgi:hypothetical protein
MLSGPFILDAVDGGNRGIYFSPIASFAMGEAGSGGYGAGFFGEALGNARWLFCFIGQLRCKGDRGSAVGLCPMPTSQSRDVGHPDFWGLRWV